VHGLADDGRSPAAQGCQRAAVQPSEVRAV